MRARSVSVPPRVSTGRILLQVGAHCIMSEMEPDSRRSLTSQASIFQSKVSHVRDKIGLPCPVARDLSSFSVVVAFFTVEPVAKFKAVAQNEIEIPETVDHLGRISERDKTGCLGSLSVEVLVPSV